jgi:FlaG protein
MSFEIGPLPPIQSGAPMRRPVQTPRADFSVALARAEGPAAPRGVDAAELSIPASPPPQVLEEIGAAADRAHQLWTENRELHFSKDSTSGRVVIEVRDRAGNTIRTIPPSQALAVLAGAAL